MERDEKLGDEFPEKRHQNHDDDQDQEKDEKTVNPPVDVSLLLGDLATFFHRFSFLRMAYMSPKRRAMSLAIKRVAAARKMAKKT